MAIFDQLGSMFGRRMDQAMMPFTNPGGYMDQRMDRRFGDLYETDEERRRREEEERRRMEQVSGPVAPPAPDQQYEAQGLQEGPAGQAMAGFRKPQPFKQTLTTDPVTGQQTMKMEGAPQDFTAANPNTPTMVSGPAIPDTGPTPDEIMREQEQARQYQQMTGQAPAVTQPAAPPPMAAAPVAPPGVAQPAPQAQQDTTRLGLQASQVVPGGEGEARAIEPPPAVAPTSQPRDLTQMAQAPSATATDVTAGTTGAVAPPPAAQPAAAAPPAPAPAAAPPAAAPAPAAAPVFGGAMATSLAAQALEQNADNTNRLLEMARDPTTSDTWKRVYAERARANVEKEDNKNKGEAAGQRAVETGRGVDRTIRKSHEPNTVGFYAKQYILRRLGLNKEADQELAKTSSTFQNVVGPDGKPYQIEVRGDGMLLAGYDGEGNKVDTKTLAEVGSMATMTKDGTPVSQRIRDSKDKEWSVVQTRNGPIFFDNERKRGTPTGPTVPISAGTDVATQARLADIRITESIIKKGVNNIQDAKKEYIDRAGPFGQGGNISEQQFEQIFAGQLSAVGRTPSVGGQQPAAAPAAAPAPAAPSAATAPTGTGMAPAAVATGAVKPTTTPPAPAPAPAPAPGGGGRFLTKPATEISTAAGTKRATMRAEAEGKVEAKEIQSQAFADSTYPLVRAINDTIKQSTGSGIGAGVDFIAGQLGTGTAGAQAIAKLQVLAGPIVAGIPRFEGPQSDKDVAEYRRQAGDFDNASKPISVRLAALDGMLMLLEKYDKAGNNDWTFGGTRKLAFPAKGGTGLAPGTERTDNGITYTYDGRGWKRKP